MNNDIDLKKVKRGDQKHIKDLKLSPAMKTELYYYWYLDFINQLEKNKQKFPHTTIAIANAIGIDRQHIYKNNLIKKRLESDRQRIGVEAHVNAKKKNCMDSKISYKEAKNFQLEINFLKNEIKSLNEIVSTLSRDLKSLQEKSIDDLKIFEHMFKNGRRVLL